MYGLSRYRRTVVCFVLLATPPSYPIGPAPVDAPSPPADPSFSVAEAGVPAIEAAYRTLPYEPTITSYGATPSQETRLAEALQRFQNAGLTLPDLTIYFHPNPQRCLGHHGLFHADQRPWRIDLCNPADWVYEHELAHAWMRHHLTDTTRQTFTTAQGYTNWADHTQPWATRGVEAAATIIQQGLLPGLIHRTPSPELTRRLTAYQQLTGRPSPRVSPSHSPAPAPITQPPDHNDYLTP